MRPRHLAPAEPPLDPPEVEDDEREPATGEPEPPENGPDEALERRGVVPRGGE